MINVTFMANLRNQFFNGIIQIAIAYVFSYRKRNVMKITKRDVSLNTRMWLLMKKSNSVSPLWSGM